MDFSHYSDDPVSMAVDLVNTLDVVSGEDHLTRPDDVTKFISQYEDEWCRPGREPEERDLHEVRALRARMREVFTAPDATAAATRLNGLLADVGAKPRVSVHDTTPPHLHFEPETDSPARWLGAVAGMGLAVAIIEGGFERLGVCGSSTCDDVFVDTSRNRSRHHCSETCTTRENVAAFRRRKRDAQE